MFLEELDIFLPLLGVLQSGFAFLVFNVRVSSGFEQILQSFGEVGDRTSGNVHVRCIALIASSINAHPVAHESLDIFKLKLAEKRRLPLIVDGMRIRPGADEFLDVCSLSEKEQGIAVLIPSFWGWRTCL